MTCAVGNLKPLRLLRFDPFFSTKPVGKGTGLGLPIGYWLFEPHGGRLCASHAGQGAVFWLDKPT